MGGRIDETNQEVENLERRIIDLEGKLVKLAALEAAFDHFTTSQSQDDYPLCPVC